MTTQNATTPETAARRAGPVWHSAHIYYHEPDKTDLLLDAIRPLMYRLRDVAPAAHVLRHWRRGPHLRLNIRADPHTWTRTIQPAIDHEIGDYLATHPSTARLDERALLAQHKLLADLEQEHGPLTPWFPDNSIQYAPFDDRLHVLGDVEAVDLLTGFYTDSTPLLFQMLEHLRSGHDTVELLGLGLMLANSITAMPPITRSFISYRSHAEGFIAQCADADATRARFDTDYQAHRTQLIDRARAVIATLEDPAAPPVPFAREWANLIACYRDRATPLIAEGKLIQPLVFDQNKAAEWPSEFHRMMFGNRAYHRAAFEDPEFSRYRLLINYTYLQINRLGLTPPQRFRLCHLAANAVEEVCDDNAIAAIRAYVTAHPNQPEQT
ncbi:hypothetical protein NE236_18420 [Actinoallomurus purpureus]|uniref:thiopeptide maturation pyridine synthase n=1 Tax=Actinoallomurus purpureus TaxID=478114 RepID=UPI002093BDAB|nr:thiopeptide maturation pyridine synthase [Actinoallomurus purpureus]MCO6006965.1 hypothetical protein [Actinoallomurus purpureus]